MRSSRKAKGAAIGDPFDMLPSRTARAKRRRTPAHATRQSIARRGTARTRSSRTRHACARCTRPQRLRHAARERHVPCRNATRARSTLAALARRPTSQRPRGTPRTCSPPHVATRHNTTRTHSPRPPHTHARGTPGARSLQHPRDTRPPHVAAPTRHAPAAPAARPPTRHAARERHAPAPAARRSPCATATSQRPRGTPGARGPPHVAAPAAPAARARHAPAACGATLLQPTPCRGTARLRPDRR